MNGIVYKIHDELFNYEYYLSLIDIKNNEISNGIQTHEIESYKYIGVYDIMYVDVTIKDGTKEIEISNIHEFSDICRLAEKATYYFYVVPKDIIKYKFKIQDLIDKNGVFNSLMRRVIINFFSMKK